MRITRFTRNRTWSRNPCQTEPHKIIYTRAFRMHRKKAVIEIHIAVKVPFYFRGF